MRLDVSDPSDPAVSPWMGLRDHKGRQRREQPGGDMAGSFMAEGDVVIARALAAGLEPMGVLIDAARTRPIAGLDDEVAVLAAAPPVLEAVCGRDRLRDPIARFRRPVPADVEAVLGRARTVAVLEGVVNPTNMGMLMRCAAGLGVEAVLIDPSSCDPLYRRAVRVSMGEVFAVPHARLGVLPEGLAPLRAHGFTTVALTPALDAEGIDGVQRADGDRLAVLVGSEGPGLTAATLAAADRRARIPMSAGVDSVNVAAAAAIAFHVLRAPS